MILHRKLLTNLRLNINKFYATKKLNSQMDIEEKKELVTVVLDNSKDLKHLQNEVENFIKSL